MQVIETISDGLKRELKVVIAAQELHTRLNAKLNEMKNTVRLKGFRPGRAPIEHLRKFYGRSVMAEVVQETVAETSKEAMAGREGRPAFQPAITFPEDRQTAEKVIEGSADLEYTMYFEILPKIELAELKTLSVEKEVAAVTGADVEKGISQLVTASVVYEPKDGAAEMGDRLTVDFTGKIDGEAFEGGSAEDAYVVLGKGGFIPGFEEGLEAAKAGEARSISVTFPEDYQARHLAGKPAEFSVTVKEVAAPRTPEVNDGFAKSLGLESSGKLKEAIRNKIEGEFETASRTKLKRALLDVLDKAHQFELPPSLVGSEFDALWGELTAQLKQANKSFEDEGASEEKAREEYGKIAERRVRLGLILAEIGQRNSIRISDEDIKRAIIERARQFPGQEGQVIDYYKKNPGATVELRAPLYEEKVIDFALELVKVQNKEVSAEELFSMPDEHHHTRECGPGCGHDHHHHDHEHK